MARKNGAGAPAAPSAADAGVVAEGFASVKEAEEFLSVSRAKLYVLMETGLLRWAKFGKSRRVPWAALRAYAASCLQGGAAAG